MMASARTWLMVGVIALPALGAVAPARADAIKFNATGLVDSRYTDPGTIGDELNPRTVKGPDAITFQGTESGSIAPGQGVRLGEFTIQPVAGVATTYDNTPFTIKVATPDLDRFDGAGYHEGGITVRGHLNGTISATGAIDLTMSLDGVEKGYPKETWAAVNYSHDFPLPTSDVILSAPIHYTSSEAVKSVTMTADVRITPEPATIALFLGAGAALAVRQRLRVGRKLVG